MAERNHQLNNDSNRNAYHDPKRELQRTRIFYTKMSVHYTFYSLCYTVSDIDVRAKGPIYTRIL